MNPTVEQERVARHIARAEARARASDAPHRGPLVSLVRELLLDELARYRRGRRFPLNRDRVGPRPTFVDAGGTRCALAALLEAGGEAALVAKIARERNHAYVAELADEPRLRAWLAAAGLSVAEAAAIQPEYCTVPADCLCGQTSSPLGPPVAGVLDTVVIRQTNPDEPALAEVRAIYGDGRGYHIGDDVRIAFAQPGSVGARFLVPLRTTDHMLDAGVAQVYGLPLVNGSWSGCGPALSDSETVRILLAPDCEAEVATIDPDLLRDSCTGHGGCSVGPGAPTALGILLALVALRVARRW